MIFMRPKKKLILKDKTLAKDFFDLIKDEENLVSYRFLNEEGLIALSTIRTTKERIGPTLETMLPFDKIRFLGGHWVKHYKLNILPYPEEIKRNPIKDIATDSVKDYLIEIHSQNMKILDIYEHDENGEFEGGGFTLRPHEKSVEIRESQRVLPFYEEDIIYLEKIDELEDLHEKAFH